MSLANLEALRDALAPDVRLFPPIQFQSFVGRELVASVLRIPTDIFAFHDSFRYVTVMSNGNEHTLFFEALIDERHIDGVDFIRTDRDGLVSELRVMIRPLPELQRFADRAKEMFAELFPSP